MGFPEINIIFKSVASNTVKRGNKGIVFAILQDQTLAKGVYEMASAAGIPATLSANNKNQLEMVFKGGVNAPKKVIAYVQDDAVTDIVDALKYAEAVKFDYLIVVDATVAEATSAASAVKAMRDNLGKRVKAVLPNTASDSEGIINFATDDIVCGAVTYDANQFCSRIAGLLAGTPLSGSITFAALAEVTDVPRMSKAAAGTAVDAGKLILFHDGEKVKVVRGVNSLVTLGSDKSEQFQKIKIVDILDTIHTDITRTAEDNYIGRVANSYENKCLLVNAVNAYFAQLENDGLLEHKANECRIDVDAQRTYLKSCGMVVDEMTDADVKSANTRDKVFLAATVKPVDSMESIEFVVTI